MMQSYRYNSHRARVTYPRKALPILFQGDVVTVGGSFSGVAAALALAAAGRTVVLIESRTYLGREMTATMRPWLWLPAGVAPSTLPQPLAACFASAYQDELYTEAMSRHHPEQQVTNQDVRWVFRLDAVKKSLEDLLLDAGVHLIYASLPVTMESDGDNHIVVIGNKSGRQALLARTVIDASETGLLARLHAPVPCRVDWQRAKWQWLRPTCTERAHRPRSMSRATCASTGQMRWPMQAVRTRLRLPPRPLWSQPRRCSRPPSP